MEQLEAHLALMPDGVRKAWIRKMTFMLPLIAARALMPDMLMTHALVVKLDQEGSVSGHEVKSVQSMFGDAIASTLGQCMILVESPILEAGSHFTLLKVTMPTEFPAYMLDIPLDRLMQISSYEEYMQVMTHAAY